MTHFCVLENQHTERFVSTHRKIRFSTQKDPFQVAIQILSVPLQQSLNAQTLKYARIPSAIFQRTVLAITGRVEIINHLRLKKYHETASFRSCYPHRIYSDGILCVDLTRCFIDFSANFVGISCEYPFRIHLRSHHLNSSLRPSDLRFYTTYRAFPSFLQQINVPFDFQCCHLNQRKTHLSFIHRLKPSTSWYINQ